MALAPPPPLPDLEPLAGLSKIVMERPADGDGAYGDVGIAVGAFGAPLRLLARRVDGQLRISQVAGGRTARTRLRGSFSDGIERFVRFDVHSRGGRRVFRSYSSFCPNGATERLDEIDPQVPPQPTFPADCGGTLTRATVWGIDRGWAAVVWPREGFAVAPGRYTLTVTVNPKGLLREARRSNNSLTLPLRVKAAPPDEVVAGKAARSKDVLLPDLRALPARDATLSSDGGRTELSFTATIWNAGPGPIWVEGRRGRNAARMETVQVLPRKRGKPLRRRVNDLVFDRRDGHDHWHYNGLGRYRLLREDGTPVETDAKQGFCFLPTDAIDLGLPGAALVPPTDLFAAGFCGSAYSLAVRMRLDAGWGDTYGSGLPGQAIDVTDVPDGTYFIEVLANATGRMHERSKANNVSRRRIVLGTGEDGRTLQHRGT